MGYKEGKGELLFRPISLPQTLNNCLEEVAFAISLPRNRDFALWTIFATSLLAALKICLLIVFAALTHCLSALHLWFLYIAASSSSWTSRYHGSSLSAPTLQRHRGACLSRTESSVLLKLSIEWHSSGETSVFRKQAKKAKHNVTKLVLKAKSMYYNSSLIGLFHQSTSVLLKITKILYKITNNLLSKRKANPLSIRCLIFLVCSQPFFRRKS